jgi:hypothetical protein
MTNKKRIEAVKRAIYMIENGRERYICSALIWSLPVYETDVFKHFPELLKHKPQTIYINEAWFHPSDTKSRIDFLKKVLTEIQNQEK